MKTCSPPPVSLLTLVCVLALAAGCGDDPARPPADSGFVIAGSVTDALGGPVAGAAILLDLAFDAVNKAASMPPADVIRFSLAEAGAVSLTLLDACHEDTLRRWELDLDGGAHSVVWDGTDDDGRELTDRSLWAVLATADTTAERTLAVARNSGDEDGDFATWDHAHVSEHVRVQATTDADGWFRIVRPCLGFGTTFPTVDEEGAVTGETMIAWRVRAWAYHPDHLPTCSTWRELDPETGGMVSVILGD